MEDKEGRWETGEMRERDGMEDTADDFVAHLFCHLEADVT